MKSLFISFLIAIVPIVSLYAQDDTQQDTQDLDQLFDFEDEKSSQGIYKFHIGLRGGVNFSKIQSSPNREGSANEESYMGYLGQIIAGYKLNNFLSVLLQSGISQQGVSNVAETSSLSSSSSLILSDSALVEYNLDYLETNLLIAIQISNGSNFIPYVFAGPSYSYLLRANASETKSLTLASTGSTFDVSNNRDASKDYKNYDWGVYLGLGFEIPIGAIDRSCLYLEGGYRHGFTDINNKSALDNHHDIVLNNSAWNISLGVAYYIF